MTGIIKQPKRYKFLQLVDTKIRSELGGSVWDIGEWKKEEGELELCKKGFHCSLRPYDAFCYCQGEILAEVDVRGEYISDCSKECWPEMRIVNAYKWRTSDSVLFARFAADLLLEHYQDDPFPELEWEIAGVQPEEAGEWVVGCSIWLREDALATTNDKFNEWMVEYISTLEEFHIEQSDAS